MRKWAGAVLLIMLLSGCSEPIGEQWPLSPTFAIPVQFSDGTEGEYVLVGQEGTVAFQVGSGESGKAQAAPILAEKPNKFMWYFWGEHAEIRGEWQVEATHESGEAHDVFVQAPSRIAAMSGDGSYAQVPSGLVFPKSGKWKLEVFLGEKRYGEIVVEAL